MLRANYSDFCFGVDIVDLRIIIIIPMSIPGCFYERFSSVSFILRTLRTTMPLNMIAGSDLKFPVFWTNDGNKIVRRFKYRLRIVISVSKDFPGISYKVFGRASKCTFRTPPAFQMIGRCYQENTMFRTNDFDFFVSGMIDRTGIVVPAPVYGLCPINKVLCCNLLRHTTSNHI